MLGQRHRFSRSRKLAAATATEAGMKVVYFSGSACACPSDPPRCPVCFDFTAPAMAALSIG